MPCSRTATWIAYRLTAFLSTVARLACAEIAPDDRRPIAGAMSWLYDARARADRCRLGRSITEQVLASASDPKQSATFTKARRLKEACGLGALSCNAVHLKTGRRFSVAMLAASSRIGSLEVILRLLVSSVYLNTGYEESNYQHHRAMGGARRDFGRFALFHCQFATEAQRRRPSAEDVTSE